MGYVELGLLNLKYDRQQTKGCTRGFEEEKVILAFTKAKALDVSKNQRAYFDIRIVDTKRLNIMILKNVISSFMASCIPLGPNKPFVFLKFRPACPRPGLKRKPKDQQSNDNLSYNLELRVAQLRRVYSYSTQDLSCVIV